jgi:hypothetical protein
MSRNLKIRETFESNSSPKFEGVRLLDTNPCDVITIQHQAQIFNTHLVSEILLLNYLQPPFCLIVHYISPNFSSFLPPHTPKKRKKTNKQTNKQNKKENSRNLQHKHRST